MMFREPPETKEKGIQNGVDIQSGGQLRIPHRPDPAGGAYDRSEWALKTNERSIVNHMPLLSEFSSYSEWGGRSQKVG